MGTIQSRALLKQFCEAVDVSRDGSWLDQHLLQAFAARQDASAFAVLVRRHGPMVLGVCRRVLGDPHEAEDAFQATFLVLVRKAASIRRQEAVSSWLYGVAYRLASRLKLKAARRRSRESQSIPHAPPPTGDLTWSELRGVLDEELNRIPEKFRAPLLLCYLEGKTQDEAARQLDWSFGTFRRRLERGREMLRDRLSRRGVTLSAALFSALLAEHVAAAVPAALLTATLQAAALFASGHGAAGSTAPIFDVAEDFMRTLVLAKLKVVAGMCAVIVFCSVALGVWAGRPDSARDALSGALAIPGEEAETQPPPWLASAADQAGFPRRLFAVSVHNYAFANPVSAGAGDRTVDRLIGRFAERLSIPAEQVVLLSDKAALPEPKAALPKLSAAELARLSDDEVKLLLDGNAVTPTAPTKAIIEHNVRRFLESCRPQDRIVLMFTGHAVEIEDQAYLVPLEGDRDDRQTLLPVRWFFDRLAECKARQKVFLVDVCRLDPTRGEERGEVAPMGKKLDALLATPPPGVQVLSACIAGQHSYELDNQDQAGVQGGIVLNLLPQLQLKDVRQRPEDSLPMAALTEALVPRTRYLARAFLKQEQTPRLSGAEAENQLPYDPKLPAAPRFKLELKGDFVKGIATKADLEDLFREIAGIPAIRGGSAAVGFEQQVLPILQLKCDKCHVGTDKYKGGLNLSSIAGVRKGSSEGQVVVPHDLQKSPLWGVVEANEMPPKGFPRLTAGEKDVIKKWIATGAKDNQEAALASDLPGLNFDSLPPFSTARLAAYAADGKTTPLSEKVREAIALLKEPANNEVLPEEFPRNFDPTNHQQRLGLVQFKLDALLEEMDGFKDDRAKESKRSQALFDLIRARLAAKCAHLAERNAVLGQMRKGLPPFDPAKQTGWQLFPREKPSDADAQRYGKRAMLYLDLLASSNAGTPWQILAQRERGIALGSVR